MKSHFKHAIIALTLILALFVPLLLFANPVFAAPARAPAFQEAEPSGMAEMFGELSPFLIIGMILGIVEFAKRMGITGKASMVLSLILGFVLGVGYQLAETIPISFADWFAVVIFALLFSLTASGLYDLGKRFAGSG